MLRWLRLTPVLALVIGIYAGLCPRLGGGPFWFKLADSAAACSRWWWSGLLYVNNVSCRISTLPNC